ncbi:MAG: carboxypeptidase regulatory-like domain-containing protein [Aureispira sp.]
MKILLLLSILLLLPILSQAQATQVIYGEVTDNLTDKPIKNVAVELLNYVPLKVAITDENGQFVLEDVPIGKHRLLATHENYDIVVIPDVSVTSGKQVNLNISLEELVINIREVVVESSTKKTTRDQPNNSMALIGIRSFNIEDVRRYSGARNDPSRLAANFAGVHIGNDIENGIIVRGNSPTTVLWQLEGMPIPSPNHYARTGLASGLWPMLNTNLMSNSDFLNGAFPAQYGNVTGGVFDVGLRSGNQNIYEGMVQVGYTGAEVGFEGPISKKNGSSFAFAYRYSIYDLLRVIGLDLLSDLTPNNQDVSFKINFGKNKLGQFSVFGLGGRGEFDIKNGDLDSNDVANQVARDITIRKQLGILGVKYKRFLTPEKKSYWQTTLGGFYDQEVYLEDTLLLNGERDIVLNNSTENINATLSSFVNLSLSYNHTIRAGIVETFYNLNSVYEDKLFALGDRNFRGNTLLSQVYVQYLARVGKKLRINVGVNAQHLLLNNTFGVGPRFAVTWQPYSSHKFSLGYGWHHQMQPLIVYFNQAEDPDGNSFLANKDLGFTQAHHITASYDWAMFDNWRLKAEGYYQLYTNVPITTYSSAFSGINMGEEFELLTLTDLVNEGLGRNVGAELTIEKFFSKDYYGLLTASYTNSQYQGSDGKWRLTPYNHSYVVNFLAGKIFKIGPKRANSFTIDINFVYASPNRFTPVDLAESRLRGYGVRQWDRAYEAVGGDYLRADVKFGFNFNNNKKNISHRIFLDLINVTNKRNILIRQYNASTQNVETAEQLGFFPDLTYRLTFGFKPKN